MPPTLAGFIEFLRNVVGISSSILPDDSPTISMAYAVALDIVNPDINAVDVLMYSFAVYNLGADNVLNYGQDSVSPPAPVYDNGQPFFQYMRTKFNIYGFVSGVIQSSSDEGTSQSLVVQEAAKTFTLSNLQNLKTPWGRQYLAIAQRSGTLWGLN